MQITNCPIYSRPLIDRGLLEEVHYRLDQERKVGQGRGNLCAELCRSVYGWAIYSYQASREDEEPSLETAWQNQVAMAGHGEKDVCYDGHIPDEDFIRGSCTISRVLRSIIAEKQISPNNTYWHSLLSFRFTYTFHADINNTAWTQGRRRIGVLMLFQYAI